MRASAASLAAAAMVAVVWSLSVFTVLGPAQPASAAEVLQRAAAARQAFDGWYTLDVRNAETGEWVTKQRVNPAQGKRFARLADDPAVLAKGLPASSWVYLDASVPVSVRYDAGRKTATVADTTDVAIHFADLPLSESQMAEWVEAGDRYAAATRTLDDGQVEIELTRKPPVPDADGKPEQGHEGWPVRIVATFGEKDGLLRTIAVQQTGAEPLSLWARLRYDTEPIASWRELIGEGVTIEDRRPDEATTVILDGLDAVLRGGLGFDTAIVVRRNGDPIRGTLSDDGTLTLYAEHGDQWAEFTWRSGEKIEGWPEPTLDAVLSHLERSMPDQVAVYDGASCWWRWDADSTWQHATGTRAKEREQYHRLAHEIWWGRPALFYSPGSKPPVIESRRDPDRSNGVIVEATVLGHWAGTPEGELVPMQTQTMLLLEDLGPLPVRKTVEVFNPDGSTRRRQQWDYGIGDLVMYREPVRVPTRWRKVVETDHDYGTVPVPQFFHLMPQPGRTLEARWFEDPTARWPAVAGTAE